MARTKQKRPNPWWSTWPGALMVGTACLGMLLPWWLAALAFIALPGGDATGVDTGLTTGPGPAPRIVVTILALASLTLPLLTVRWGRKVWLGYLLLGVTLSAGYCVAGLGLLGVL